MDQCTTIHCTGCLPMHQCTKVEPAPLCTMQQLKPTSPSKHYAQCILHCTAQELDQLHPQPRGCAGRRHQSRPGGHRPAQFALCTFSLKSRVHNLHFALLVLKAECTRDGHRALHILYSGTQHCAGPHYVCKSSAQQYLVLCTALCAQKATGFPVQVLFFSTVKGIDALLSNYCTVELQFALGLCRQQVGRDWQCRRNLSYSCRLRRLIS